MLSTATTKHRKNPKTVTAPKQKQGVKTKRCYGKGRNAIL